MLGYVANTDFDWYSFLRAQPFLDEVNFWQPSGGHQFRAVPPGAPFFFKLKNPHYVIAGYGYLARALPSVPDWLASDSFLLANGAPDFDTMRRRIRRYRRADPPSGSAGEYRIGCLMISQPIFFDEPDWISEPAGWARNIVSGKTYDLSIGEGRRLWDACLARTQGATFTIQEERARYGEPILVAPRLGQGTFRLAVTDAYDGACAVSGEHSLPVLDVAHIQRYADGGDHIISNGLLLRTDIHRLFDRGYVTVTPDYRFEVSHLLKDQYENGHTYYRMHGHRITLPKAPENRPLASAFQWHNENVFRS
jgi:putative restriction endonuclease